MAKKKDKMTADEQKILGGGTELGTATETPPAENEPAAQLISNDRAQEIFDQLGIVTNRRTECEAAKEKASNAKKDLDSAQGRLEEMLYDARSGQSRLFSEGTTPAADGSAPAGESEDDDEQ